MRTYTQIAMLLATSMLVTSCYYDSIYEEVDTTETPNVSYQEDITPIWNLHCISCHDGATIPLNLLNGESYDELLNGGYILPGNAGESDLYKSLLGIDGLVQMPPETVLPASTINLVRDWINQGALNN